MYRDREHITSTMDAHFRKTKAPSAFDSPPAKGKDAAAAPRTPARPSGSASAALAAVSATETPPRLFGWHRSTTSPHVDRAYSTVQRATGAIGGNAAGGAIYGEITKSSTQRILDVFRDKCGFGAGSAFIDIGAGLGKPNFHASIDGDLAISVGVELDRVRWHLSLVNLQKAVADRDQGGCLPTDRPRVYFQHGDITDARTLDPFTHVYMFDTGFPPAVSRSIARAFNASRCTRYVACMHNPKLVLDDWGMHAELVARVQTQMSGSGEGHLCFIYAKKSGKRGAAAAAAAAVKEEAEVDGSSASNAVVADPMFSRALRMLRGDMGDYMANLHQMIADFHAQPRPRRGCRSRAVHMQQTAAAAAAPNASLAAAVGGQSASAAGRDGKRKAGATGRGGRPPKQSKARG